MEDFVGWPKRNGRAFLVRVAVRVKMAAKWGAVFDRRSRSPVGVGLDIYACKATIQLGSSEVHIRP